MPELESLSVGFNLRIATTGDLSGIGAVYEASYPVLMARAYDPQVLHDALPLMVRANPKLIGADRFWIAATSDGRIVSCGGWSLERPGSGEAEAGLGHIRHFATHPDWTGRGLATAIFRRCATAAKDNGVTQLECYSSLNAEGFYRSVGFVTVEHATVPMGPTVNAFPVVRMRCRIA